MRIERSLPTSPAGPTAKAAVSFGEWIVILVVCLVVSLLVAGAAVFLLMRSSESMPGLPERLPFATPEAQASPVIMEQVVEYEHDGTILEGFLVFDASYDDPRPGVMIVHQWMGLGDYERRRARELAELGYVAFCADIYGRGVRPQNRQEAAAEATKYRSDRPLLRARAQAGLSWMKMHPFVDSTRVAAIGYCFGGGTVLELARGGADLNGVVSFHGNLDTPDPADAANIQCSVMVMHGADDPHVSQESVATFIEEMRAQEQVDWLLVQFGNSVHGFSEEENEDAYNEKADLRSWEMMLDFFNELFYGQ